MCTGAQGSQVSETEASACLSPGRLVGEASAAYEEMCLLVVVFLSVHVNLLPYAMKKQVALL